MPDICQRLVIGASAEKVYNAITSQEGLQSWWTPAAETNSELNSVARFPFGNGYFKEMKIVELIPFEKIGWACITGADEWVGTRISFQFTEADKKQLQELHPEVTDQLNQSTDIGEVTVLGFLHAGWKDESPMFAECSYTWAQFLRSLKLYCETGKGNPWPHQHEG